MPTFCPAMTDGSIDDMLCFFSYEQSCVIVDVVGDIRRSNDLTMQSHETRVIVVGGALVKHHAYDANLMRTFADWSVFVYTDSEFDGSDTGADPDEAISWVNIQITDNPV